ncbi:VCBS domain-containing protein, partial [Arthrospira platensis SPKY1]|nr:VCBS domain-containing protein [Arthrospira platensis SPKY1]
DAPVITGGPVVVGLDETDAGLSSTGTLTVSDVDTSDTVTASVDGLVVTGTSDRADPAAPSDADLLVMLTVTPNVVGDDENSNTLTWTFDSDGETFDYLADGETLILTYTVEVEDSQGATTTETITITITGTNDAPVITGGPVVVGLDETDAGLSSTGTLTVSDV